MGEWRIEGVPATFRIEEEAQPPQVAAPQAETAVGDADTTPAAVDAANAAIAAAAAKTDAPPSPPKQTLVIVFDESVKNIESRVFNAMIMPMQKLFNEALRATKKTMADFPPPPRTARAVPPAAQAAHAAEVAADNAEIQAEAAPAGQPRTSAERAGLRPPRHAATGPIAAPQAAPRGHRPAPAAPSLARRPAGAVPNLGVKR